MTTVEKEEGIIPWLKYKINYGLTFKGMITFTIVWEFCIILFLSTFSQPIEAILGQPLLAIPFADPLTPDGNPFRDVEKAGRLIMVYHSIAVPFIATCTYFVLEFMDVREKFKSRVKWPLFIGSILASASGMIFAYILPEAWIIHGLYLVGLSLTFYAGVILLIGVFPTKSFPKRDQEAGRNIFVGQLTLALLAFCILVSVIIGAAVGAFFGNGMIPLLAEYFLRHDIAPWNESIYPIIFVDGIKAHLHIMLALIDVIILLIVYRYTVPDQKGRWYLLSMVLVIPGMLIMSIGAWLVTFGDIIPFDAHYLIYAGSGILVLVGVILALTGWNRTSKGILGDTYESASWFSRAKAVFKDPVKFSLYFLFIWVNFVMTFSGIFLALSLDGGDDPSILTRVTSLVAFREGPLAVETTVARGHWHVLATLSAVILLLLFIDMIDIQGLPRKLMGWLLFAGSVIAFGFAVIYMYFPHMDQDWAVNLTKYADVQEYWESIASWLPLALDLGIMLFVIAITIFCFHQLIEILKGRKDVKEFPE
ncbi:MAG: hypothetical protein JSV04_12400 [Candidatus Heimdallarchaeota archaeon]|nr:MAG: hypothetical protein JSV04_12400 [Candidatus Heimdallarchaeota archaeon]